MKKFHAYPLFVLLLTLMLGSRQSAAQTTAVRFAVIGDYGKAGQGEQAVADMVKGWNPDFIITTGDNNYPRGSATTIDDNIGQYYHEFIFPYTGSYGTGADSNRFFPTLGNHDWQTDSGQPYLDYFTLPGNERYYDFVQGPVHFFALNADFNEPDGLSSHSIQAEWLRERLAISTAPWKLVYMHISPYSSGRHGSHDVMRWPYQEWGASAVITGHDHLYERLLVDGFPYFVNGAGGGGLYGFNTPIPGSEARYNRSYGAMLVEATETTITFQFYAIGNSTPIDSYTLSH